MHIHDLNATILHLLGIDHRKLTYRYQDAISVSLISIICDQGYYCLIILQNTTV